MLRLKQLTRWFLALAAVAAFQPAALAQQRVVSVDGTISEIVHALGAADRLVGVDTTSVFPAAMHALPKVGYKRALSAEGLLSLQPDLVLYNQDAGPPVVLQQLQQAGLQLVKIPNKHSVDGTIEKVRAVAKTLDLASEGEALVERIRQEIADATPVGDTPPRVVFVLHIGAGSDLAAGGDTSADGIISLAGGVNALGDAFTGYKPITAEAMVGAAPDVILVTERNLAQLGGVDSLLQRAGMAATPAGTARRVVPIDGLMMLGFGPRLPQAMQILSEQFALAEASASAE
ncbi:MAG: ABC transporter substrate-binding protein [Pseudomonadota bacterium]